MIIGMLLLDQDDVYAREDGKLPLRPSFDKQLLVGACENQNALCSSSTAEHLPPSVTSILKGLNNKMYTEDIALSPDMIDQHAHLLIITRNLEEGIGGKKFRFDKFKRLVKMYDLEIWGRDYEKETNELN